MGEDHGKNSMWRSRLDCNETTWVADPVGLDKGEVWIQWDFPSMKTITAVQTRGRPNRDEWVTGYHLQYSTSTALDDHHDWKLRPGHHAAKHHQCSIRCHACTAGRRRD